MKRQNRFLIGLIFLCTSYASAQYVTDPLPYAPIANPLPDTMAQLQRDSLNLKMSKFRLNQAGYRPQDEKLFYYIGSASNFSVIDAVSGNEVGTGSMSSTGKSMSGQLDITCFHKATLTAGGAVKYHLVSPVMSGAVVKGYIPNLPKGQYKIKIGSDISHPFYIGQDVYSMVRDVLLKYYGIARCGDNDSWFHAGCHLKDAVVGGWHDAGDHLKLPQSIGYTFSVLSLCASALSSRDQDHYAKNQGITKKTDGMKDVLVEAKVGADYLVNSYKAGNNSVSGMKTEIGEFGKDHSWWGRPENQDVMQYDRGGPVRPAVSGLGGNTAGSFAAGLAMFGKIYQPYDSAYSALCIKIAKELYAFGKGNQKSYYNSAMSGGGRSNDELALAALGLWYATKENTYKNDLLYDKTIGPNGNQTIYARGGFAGGWMTAKQATLLKDRANSDWDNMDNYVLWGLYRLILIDEVTAQEYSINAEERLNLIEDVLFTLIANINSVSAGDGDQILSLPTHDIQWLQNTLKCTSLWGWMHNQQDWMNNRYQAGNITDLYMYYDIASKMQGIVMPHAPANTDWKADSVKSVLIKQMNYMLGMNPWDVSMIIGAGEKNLNHPHHRASNPELVNVPGKFYSYVPPVGGFSAGYNPSVAVYEEFMGGNANPWYHTEVSIDATTSIFLPVMGLAKEDTLGAPGANVKISYVGCDKTIITIDQTRLGTAEVNYRKTDGTTYQIIASNSPDVTHQITIDKLERSTTYQFNVKVQDIFGRDSIIYYIDPETKKPVDFSFTTLPNCPSNAEIVNVKVCNVTHDSAHIFWYTPNGEFDSRIVYGTSKPPTTEHDGDVAGHPVKFHNVKIGNLKEKTTYYFYVQSGESVDDNQGQLYTFTTSVMHVDFDVRAVRYSWGDKPGIGINVVNQDSKAYDSLDLRLYFRAKEGFEADLGARLDICVLYREDGFQDVIEGDLRQSVWNNLVKQKPTKIEDTYDPSDQTYAYYLSLPLWDIEMRSQSRIRLDVIFVTWEKDRMQDQLDQPPEHKITDKDWSFGPHSTENGDPVNFPGVAIGSKADIDEKYHETPINYYITVYRKGVYVWGYSPSKAELATKKTHYEIQSQITSPVNNPSEDYYLYEGSGKTVTVKGYAKVTPVDGSINEIWVNGVKFANISSAAKYNEATGYYDLDIPVPVKNGRNQVDVTIFAGPSQICEECYGCAVTNHSFFLEAPFIQQYPSQIAVKDQNMNAIGDTVKIDTTQFHIIVTDKNGNINKKGKDSLSVSVYNPVNGDSTIVTLIETADSSNVFQTVTPIKVVNLPPEQTGKTQIAMGGAEQMIITYVDPTDESDSSKVVLYSRAEFPVPLAGWFYDSDGNGSVDKLVVVYNQKLKEDPDSIQIAFPNAGSVKMLKKPADTFSMDDKKEIVTFGTAVENITGFTSGLNGNGISYIVSSNRLKSLPFTVKDSAGPVLLNQAVLSEREGNGDDTITVTFSESVSFDNLKGNVLLLRKKGTDYPVKVNAIRGVVQGTYTVTLNVQCDQKIEEGDSLLIDPSGILDDLAANRAHPKNKPVVITVKAAPPQLVSACYRDLNADGVIDRIYLTLSKPVVVQECTFVTKWNDKKESRIDGSNASVSDGDSRVLEVTVKGNEITGLENATSGVMMIAVEHKKFGTTNTVMVSDSAAPVILGATFRKSADETMDTLEVEFSEAVDVVPVDAFLLFSIKDAKEYSFASKEKGSTPGISKKVFLISEIYGVESPARNDSIWLRPDAGVKDMNGNEQKNPMNKRALLKIGQMPLNLTIISGPNPFLPGVSEISNDQDIPDKIRGKKGFLVKINLGKAGPLSIAAINGKFRIFDVLGNLIFTGTLLKGTVSDQNNYYFLWEGINKKGRLVGTGSYLARLEVETPEISPDEPSQRRDVTLKIGVKRTEK